MQEAAYRADAYWSHATMSSNRARKADVNSMTSPFSKDWTVLQREVVGTWAASRTGARGRSSRQVGISRIALAAVTVRLLLLAFFQHPPPSTNLCTISTSTWRQVAHLFARSSVTFSVYVTPQRNLPSSAPSASALHPTRVPPEASKARALAGSNADAHLRPLTPTSPVQLMHAPDRSADFFRAKVTTGPGQAPRFWPQGLQGNGQLRVSSCTQELCK
jgi:hypothetical protein